jgi:hypothetical protein
MLGATQALAHGLSQRDAVAWAVDACRRVETRLPPEQREAITAAEAVGTTPSAINRASAATAAAKVGVEGPAGLAARAASLVDVADAPPVPGADTLLPTCVVGAVASAVSCSAKPLKPPRQAAIPTSATPVHPLNAVDNIALPPAPGAQHKARNATAFKPFIDAGLALAAGAAPTRTA